MEDKESKLKEEGQDPDRAKLSELEAEARFLRRFGIVSAAIGVLMCVPAIVLSERGYDMRVLDTWQEMAAGASMLCSIAPFGAGILAYMKGNVELYERLRSE